jgi:hypothetical protein
VVFEPVAGGGTGTIVRSVVAGVRGNGADADGAVRAGYVMTVFDAAVIVGGGFEEA